MNGIELDVEVIDYLLSGLPPIECTTHITGRLPIPALRSLRLISSLRYIKDRLKEYKLWKLSAIEILIKLSKNNYARTRVLGS